MTAHGAYAAPAPIIPADSMRHHARCLQGSWYGHTAQLQANLMGSSGSRAPPSPHSPNVPRRVRVSLMCATCLQPAGDLQALVDLVPQAN